MMLRLKAALDWVATTTGVILVMSGFMLGMTISTVANYELQHLPARWWLVVLSSMAAGSGVWVLHSGPTKQVRFWVGLLWALYGATRGMSWLWVGSWSGLLPWVPCLLLGLVVFARRRATPYGEKPDEQQA